MLRLFPAMFILSIFSAAAVFGYNWHKNEIEAHDKAIISEINAIHHAARQRIRAKHETAIKKTPPPRRITVDVAEIEARIRSKVNKQLRDQYAKEHEGKIVYEQPYDCSTEVYIATEGQRLELLGLFRAALSDARREGSYTNSAIMDGSVRLAP